MKRHLAAVLAADICDYSRLMGEDSEAMLGALRRLRAEVFGPSVASRRGRIVKNMGDGWIVLFGSAVEAVESAMQVQDRLAEGAKPGEPEIRMRVGIHLGDVVEEDDDVFGDGVNVAARLEQATAPGTTAISEAVLGSLDGTLRPSFDEAGVWQLKNIARPVQVWVRGESVTVRRQSVAALEGLTIGIQPIQTRDTRSEVAELASAVTGDVTAYLDATIWMTASTAQKTEGADYVLDGTLRGSGDRLRLETVLSDARGAVVRKDKFDGALSDAFDWQDSVAEDVSGVVLQAVYDAELARLSEIDDAAKTASDFILHACLAFENLDDGALNATLDYASRAVELDPDRPSALYFALYAYASAVSVGLEEVWSQYTDRHKTWLAAARPLWPKVPMIELFSVYFVAEDDEFYARVRVLLDKILRGGSPDFVTLSVCGYTYTFLGMPDHALDCLHKARKLGRKTPWRLAILAGLGNAHLQAGQYDKTLANCRQILEISPDYLAPYRQQAAAFAQMGQMDDAHAAASELLRRKPDFSISGIRRASRYADTPGTRRYFEGMRMAGLPE